MSNPSNQLPVRRDLHFQSLLDINADIQNLLAKNNGQIHTTGQLTPAQNIGHNAFYIYSSVHGFPYKLPWPIRIVGRLMRKNALNKPIPTGIKMPFGLRHLNKINFPPADLPLATAVENLNLAIKEAQVPGAMCQESRLLGQLSETQWLKLHCLHADLHFSFLY